MQEAAELVSLGWTPSTMIFATLTLWFFVGESLGIIRRGPKSAEEWLILGVTISFIGKFFDNGYWGVAWSSSYLESTTVEWLFEHGVYCNIPFRQFTGTIAGYCHTRAAYERYLGVRGKAAANRWVGVSAFAGLVFVLCLMAAKP